MAQDRAAMRKFEDLEVGEKRISREREITQQEIVDFAVQYDPQWFHADPEAAKDSIFGEVVASGIHIAAIWRQLDHEINQDTDFICGVAWEKVRWAGALRGGDRVRAVSEILSKRESRSQPDRGIAEYRYALINDRDEEIFSCISINLVRRRAPAKAGAAAR